MTSETIISNQSCRKVGYVRVSDRDQTEALQIDALKAAGCDLIYGDHGVSGKITTRKGLSELLQALQEGDTLMVWKLDRLGRSTLHLLTLLYDLRKRGIDFHIITQGIDTRTAIGRMVFGQLAVFAEFEREQISERTKAGMKAAKARGVHIGRPRKLNQQQIQRAYVQVGTYKKTITHLAAVYGVAPTTLTRALRSYTLPKSSLPSPLPLNSSRYTSSHQFFEQAKTKYGLRAPKRKEV